MAQELDNKEVNEVVPSSPERVDQLSVKNGTVSGQEVKNAAGPTSDLSAFPKVSIDGGKPEWQPPTYGYISGNIGPEDGGKSLNFGRGYDGATEFEKYTNSANFDRQGKEAESLNLAGARLSPEQLKMIDKYPNLQSLDLSGNYINNQDLETIAANKKLKTLNLGGSAFDDQGAQVLGSMPSLETLKVDSYKLTDDFTKSIASLPNLKSLSFDRHTDSAQSVANLEHTNLSDFKPPLIFDPGEADKAAGYMGNMKGLKALNLSLTRMTDAGMEKLSHLPNLEKLNLSSSFELTGKSVEHLARMTNLKELDLSYASKLRPSDIQKLQEALPGTVIKSDLIGQKIDASADERRLAGTIGHDLELLSGVTGAPEHFAKEVVNQFAGMTKDKVNLIGQLLEESPYKPVVKRDAQGNVESIAYTREDNRLSEAFTVAPFIAVTLAPRLLTEKAVRAINRGRGDDVQLQFGPGHVSLEARQYSDVTGKGYWHGSNKLSQPQAFSPNNKIAPYYKN